MLPITIIGVLMKSYLTRLIKKELVIVVINKQNLFLLKFHYLASFVTKDQSYPFKIIFKIKQLVETNDSLNHKLGLGY